MQAWLDPINLPSGKSCVCDICGNPMQFLLQVCVHFLYEKFEVLINIIFCALQNMGILINLSGKFPFIIMKF